LIFALEFISDKRLVGKPFVIEGKRIFCGDQVSQLMHNACHLYWVIWKLLHNGEHK